MLGIFVNKYMCCFFQDLQSIVQSPLFLHHHQNLDTLWTLISPFASPTPRQSFDDDVFLQFKSSLFNVVVVVFVFE